MRVELSTFRRLLRARELLADEALTVREVAGRVGLSPFHFIRVFGGVFGDTPHQFRTRVRIERAKGLLARGATVTEACLDVGFASVGSFSALFARRVGTPPSAFRRAFALPRAVAAAPPSCLGLLEQFWRSAPAAAWA